MKLEKEYEGKLKQEKERFEQKLSIFKQVHGMADAQNLEQAFGGMSLEFLGRDQNFIDEIDQNSSVEYAKAQVLVSQANKKNQELASQISELQTTIKYKDEEIEHLIKRYDQTVSEFENNNLL